MIQRANSLGIETFFNIGKTNVKKQIINNVVDNDY